MKGITHNCLASLLENKIVHKVEPGATYEYFDGSLFTNSSNEVIYFLAFTGQELGEEQTH